MTAAEALAGAAARLPGPTARLDAELLLAHLLGITRERLLLEGVSWAVDGAAWEGLVARRAAGEPVAYITGEREFWSLPLRVTPDVLIPRPDSETLIEAAVELRRRGEVWRVLDLGTGSGALLLAALSEFPDATGVGVDRSGRAAAVARGNAVRLGLGGRAMFLVSDWAAAVRARFDLVLCNPPYVAEGAPLGPGVAEHEPHGALFAGPDGLRDYARILPDLGRLLAPGGLAILEIGAEQPEMVGRLAQAAGFAVRLRHDLEGRPRAIILHQPEQE